MLLTTLAMTVFGGAIVHDALVARRRAKRAADRALNDDACASAVERAAPPVESERQMGRNSVRVQNTTKKLWISVGSMTAAGMGSLVYPPLRLLCLPGIAYVTKDLVVTTIEEVRERRRLSVDALVTIVAIVCIKEGFLFGCCLNMTLAVLSRHLTAATRHESESDVRDLFANQAETARRVEGDAVEVIPFDAVAVGQIVRVHAGEVIPVDGRIVRGAASIDQHALTGEAQPVERGVGEPVYSMTMVFAGSIDIVVERAGVETIAAEIGRLLEATMNQKTDSQIWAEDLGNKTVLPTLVASGAMLPILGPSGALAIAQSHPKFKPIITSHLGLLTTFSAMATRGVLVKNARALEILAEVDTVVFDKTGTLTSGTFAVGAVHVTPAYSAEYVLRSAASVEAYQSHPIADAILQRARADGLTLAELDCAEVAVGFGLKGVVEGHAFTIGSPRFLAMEGIDSVPFAERIEACARARATTSYSSAWVGAASAPSNCTPKSGPKRGIWCARCRRWASGC